MLQYFNLTRRVLCIFSVFQTFSKQNAGSTAQISLLTGLFLHFQPGLGVFHQLHRKRYAASLSVNLDPGWPQQVSKMAKANTVSCNRSGQFCMYTPVDLLDSLRTFLNHFNLGRGFTCIRVYMPSQGLSPQITRPKSIK